MPADLPLISVALPVYNAGEPLVDCLHSLAEQTLESFEIVAIDDGSTDGSSEILHRVSQEDPRFRVLTNPENAGLGISLNRAIASCKGEFVARQDADDWSAPDRLAKQYEYLVEHPEVGFVGTAFATTDTDGATLSTTELPAGNDLLQRVLRRRNLLAHGSVMFRRELFERIGGYRPFFKLAQDYDLWLRLLEHSEPGAIRDVLYFHRLSHGSSGGQRKELQEWYARTAQRCARLRAEGIEDDLAVVSSDRVSTRTFSSAPLVMGICLLKGGRRAEARRQLIAAMGTGGWRPRMLAMALWAVSFAPEIVVRWIRALRWRWDRR